MATLVRRTWANLRDEVIVALGGADYTGFSSRVEQYLYSTYLELTLGFHQFEMETSATASVAQGDTSIPIPTDCFILIGVYRPTVAGLGNMLDLKRVTFLTGKFSSTQGTPSEYTRFGSTIVLNCPVAASPIAGTWSVRYYKVPAAPDYATSTSPATSWLWDDALIQGTLAKMYGKVWRPDLGMVAAQPLKEWLAMQVQPELRSEVLAELPDYPTASRPSGGAQG